MKNEDIVNHPNHYTSYQMETLTAISGQSTLDEYRGFLKGNVIKYVARYRFKNGVEDLKKAQFYLEKLKTVEENNPSVSHGTH